MRAFQVSDVESALGAVLSVFTGLTGILSVRMSSLTQATSRFKPFGRPSLNTFQGETAPRIKKQIPAPFKLPAGLTNRQLETLAVVAVSRCRSLHEAGYDSFSDYYSNVEAVVTAELIKRAEQTDRESETTAIFQKLNLPVLSH